MTEFLESGDPREKPVSSSIISAGGARRSRRKIHSFIHIKSLWSSAKAGKQRNEFPS